MNKIRLKLATALLKVSAWLLCKNAVTPNRSEPTHRATIDVKRYYVSYAFAHSWPHLNSPRQLHFGATTLDMRAEIDSSERIEQVRTCIIHALGTQGIQAPKVSIVSFQKIADVKLLVESPNPFN